MSQADLVADLKASLQDSAKVFVAANDADFTRLLSIAAGDLLRVRPLIVSGELALEADMGSYVAPAAMVRFYRSHWLDKYRGNPWDADWAGPFPRVALVKASTARLLYFTPAPSARQIAVLGHAYAFDYCVPHVIGAQPEDTTVDAADHGLLLLRAQAEACKELSIRNLSKPVSLGPAGASVGSMPKNGSPAGLYELLMQRFEAAA